MQIDGQRKVGPKKLRWTDAVHEGDRGKMTEAGVAYREKHKTKTACRMKKNLPRRPR